MDIKRYIIFIFILILLCACNKPAHTAPYINFSQIEAGETPEPTEDPYIPPTRGPELLIYTPTPSPPKPLPTIRTEDVYYEVQLGDTLKLLLVRKVI